MLRPLKEDAEQTEQQQDGRVWMEGCISPRVTIFIVSWGAIYYCVMPTQVEKQNGAENSIFGGCAQTLGGCLVGDGQEWEWGGGNWNEDGGSEKFGEENCGSSECLFLLLFPWNIMANITQLVKCSAFFCTKCPFKFRWYHFLIVRADKTTDSLFLWYVNWWEGEDFCPLWVEATTTYPSPRLKLGLSLRQMWSVMPLIILSSCNYLELFFIVLEGFHYHTHSLHWAFQPAIHPVKAVHAARHVYHQAQALGFLLGASQLREGTTESCEPENHHWLLFWGSHSHRPRVPAMRQASKQWAQCCMRQGERLLPTVFQ